MVAHSVAAMDFVAGALPRRGFCCILGELKRSCCAFCDRAEIASVKCPDGRRSTWEFVCALCSLSDANLGAFASLVIFLCGLSLRCLYVVVFVSLVILICGSVFL